MSRRQAIVHAPIARAYRLETPAAPGTNIGGPSQWTDEPANLLHSAGDSPHNLWCR